MTRNADHSCLQDYVSDREYLISVAFRIVKSRAVAEEIVQESWLRWNGRGYAPDRSRSLFRRIVTNLALDQCRRWKREAEILDMPAFVAETVPCSERVVSARQDLAVVMAELKRMPPRKVEALHMRLEEGAAYAEIGRRLGVSKSRAHELVEDALVGLAIALE